MARLARTTVPATVTATTATTTTAPTVSTAAAAISTSATWRTSFPRTRFIDREGTSLNCLAIELSNGILCVLFGCHCHKRKAARLACELVLHKHDILHGSGLCKEVLQVGFRRIERKIPHV